MFPYAVIRISKVCCEGSASSATQPLSLHMHRLAEIADDPLRAQAAGFFLIRIASLALQQLVILDRHTAAANPVIPVS